MNVVMTQRLSHGATLPYRMFGLTRLMWDQIRTALSQWIPITFTSITRVQTGISGAALLPTSPMPYRFSTIRKTCLPATRWCGWSLNGIVTSQSGMPFNVTLSGDVANIGITGEQRPNVVGTLSENCGAGHRTACIASSAFATPAAYTFGDASRNIMNGPGYENFDGSVFKEFPMTERARLQLRAEFFNAFNTPSFAEPNAVFATSSFGSLTSTSNNNRDIQFAGRIISSQLTRRPRGPARPWIYVR